MTIRNRELSQFGSFIYIDNNTKDIGITTEATPYVGIGTTNAQEKLHVVGNTILNGNLEVDDVTITNELELPGDLYVTGISTFTGITTFTNDVYTQDVYTQDVFSNSINASSFYLNGNSLVEVTVQTWIQATGNDIYRAFGNVGIGTSTNLYKLSVNGQIESQASQGTAPFVVQSTTNVPNLNASLLSGKSAPTGDIVGTTATQTLTSKTINLTNNTLSGNLSQFNTALSDANFVSTTGTETLTNKTLTTPVISSISNSGIQTVPTGNGILVSSNSLAVINRPMLGDLQLVNTDIASNANIEFSKISTVGVGNSIENDDIANSTIQNTKLVSSTISGISLGSNLNTLSPGTYLSGDPYNGSTARTWNISATSSNTADTIVSRDSNGDFTAGTITATDFNSTSDINLKTNINTVNNALEITNQLRGVSFDWLNTNKSSYGVIAQEIEDILPELVNTSDVKSVNYNGLIGILIEAVKELSLEVKELKDQLNR